MAIGKSVSYLRNNLDDVSSIAQESSEEVYCKLKEAEQEMQINAPLRFHDEVFCKLYSQYEAKQLK